jgi:hypothetical protein
MNGVDFRGTFASLLGSRYPLATLTRYTAGAYDSANPTSGTSKTSIDYPCRAQVTKYAEGLLVNDQVRAVDADLIVFLGSLPIGIVPRAGDKVTFTVPGTSTTTFGFVQGDTECNDSAATMTVKVVA